MSRCRNSRQHGRRNVFVEIDCRCRNSWPEGRRNASGTTIRRPRTCENPSRSAGPGRKGTTGTAGNTRKSSIIYCTAPVPGGVASGQTHQNAHNLVPLLPSSIRRFWGLPETSWRKSMRSAGDAENDPQDLGVDFFLCGVGRTSEPFDESSARIFVRGDPGTSNFRAI